MKNRILAALCAAAMFLSLAVTVSADAGGALFDLRGLGIFDGVSLEQNDGSGFTRGEFSRILTNMMNIDPEAAIADGGYSFTDVQGSTYAAPVSALKVMGIVNGGGDACFHPENKVRPGEAAKMLVNVLGYGVTVRENSLAGFLQAAANIGLLRGVAAQGEYLTTAEMIRMLDNALDIEVLTVSHWGGGKRFEKGDTYRQALTEQSEYTVTKLRGTVTADPTAYIKTKITDLRRNELEIDGKIYRFEGDAPTGLIGVCIDFYQRTYPDGTQEAYAWEVSAKNEIHEFKSEDIAECRDSRLSLENGTDITISAAAVYLYNGRPDDGWSTAKMARQKQVDYRTIDSDEDGEAETVLIWEYENRIVERTGAENFVVYLEGKENAAKYVTLDVTEKSYYAAILNTDGTKAEFSNIETGMVISLAISKDGEAKTAVLSSDTAEGILSAISDEALTVGDKVYAYDMDTGDLVIGGETVLLLNFRGVAVDIKAAESKNLGYIYAVDPGKGISGSTSVKMLIAGPVATRYIETEDTESGGASTKTAELYSRNELVAALRLADRVRVDNKSYTAEELGGTKRDQLIDTSGQVMAPVRYSLDSEGKIKSITHLEALGTATQKYYNANELMFGKMGREAFGITQNETKAVCLPTNTDATDDDLLVYTKMANGVLYNVIGYDVDSSTHLADMIVIRAEMRSGLAGIVGVNADTGLVQAMKTVATEEGGTAIKAEVLTGGELRSYTVSDLIPDSEAFGALKKGDLITFTVDGYGRMDGFRLLQGADDYVDKKFDEGTAYERFCGIVRSVDYNFASPTRNRWVHQYGVGYSDSEEILKVYDVFARGKTPVFVLEKADRVRCGSYDDIQIGSRVFFSVNSGNTRAVVVDNR